MRLAWFTRARQALAARIRAWQHHDAPADPSLALFRAIRRRMTLWFCAVLAAILLLAGSVLYVGMRQELFRPVDRANVFAAGALSKLWTTAGQPPCGAGIDIRPRVTTFYACYDTHGALTGSNRFAGDVSAFLAPSLARSALANGSASDTVDAGSGIGAISRYAAVVRDPQSQQVVGVIQVGLPTAGELRALQALLSLLIFAGLVTLVGAGVGGLWLAGRAMEPARLGAQRQQQFIADVSHEIRTPLALLRADAEALLLDRAQFPARDAELLDDLVTETIHLTRLAHNLLLLARLDAHALPVARAPVDLAAIAAQVAERVQALAAAQGVTVTVQASPPIYALGDPERISDAALILAENAIKYQRAGGAVALAAAEQDGQARLLVSDDGPGMTPEHLAHLGERFYRPDAARSRTDGGAGLGVAIAKEIAHTMRGTLTYASQLDAGTTATLAFPLAPPGA